MKYEDTILYSIIRPIIKLFMKIFYRIEIINKDIIPNNEKIILAGNHTSILDPLLLISSTKRHIHFLAKIELFKRIKGFFFKNLGLIPVNRKIKDKIVLENAKHYLDNNKVIGIFPEGTTEKENFPNLLPFKIGAIKLAKDTNTKIIPFKIIGRYKLFRKNVKIVFGDIYIVNKDYEESNKELYDIINFMKE